ncbi:MAG TPA: hypothetical protein VG755_29810 [Nannocystaceae bacterium]|nr:hypothetical protein [Nannocystaceae bacterium]
MSVRRVASLLLLFASLAAAPACAHDQKPIAGPDGRSKEARKLQHLHMSRAEADALIEKLARLPKFPLRLSELEAHVGRKLRRHYTAEQNDPTFVHDRGGTGANNGGNPVFHPSVDPGTPLLVELRSKYYARYDTERKFDRKPPFPSDDPIIDLITISDEYAHGSPPKDPGTSVFPGEYDYIGERWSIAPLRDGFISLLSHDREVNPGAQRWIWELTSDRGYYSSPAEIAQTEAMLARFIDAIGSGVDMATMLAELEREHAADYDTGILQLGLASYNIRYFDVATSEGAFLREEGKKSVLYIDFYIQGDARVPLPKFFAALGATSATVDPASISEIAAGLRDGGLLYYDNVTVEKDGWYAKATGFYRTEKGVAASTLDLSRFLVESLTIRHEVR